MVDVSAMSVSIARVQLGNSGTVKIFELISWIPADDVVVNPPV